jgi:hypothetical protein
MLHINVNVPPNNISVIRAMISVRANLSVPTAELLSAVLHVLDKAALNLAYLNSESQSTVRSE